MYMVKQNTTKKQNKKYKLQNKKYKTQNKKYKTQNKKYNTQNKKTRKNIGGDKETIKNTKQSSQKKKYIDGPCAMSYYPNLPQGRKLLIFGENHYTPNPCDENKKGILFKTNC